MPELDQPRKLELEPPAKSSLVLPEIYIKLETRKVRNPTPRLPAGFFQSLKIFWRLVFEKMTKN